MAGPLLTRHLCAQAKSTACLASAAVVKVRILHYTSCTMKVHVCSRKFSVICELPYLLWANLSVKIDQLQCNIPSNTYHAVYMLHPTQNMAARIYVNMHIL